MVAVKAMTTMDGAAAANVPTIGPSTFYLLINHGQSNAQGVGENVALTIEQPYGNLSFNGGVRPGNVAANMVGTSPLVEYRNPTGDQPPGGGAGETGLAAWANDTVRLEMEDTNTDWRQLAKYFAYFGGEGGRPIGYFAMGFQGWTNWLDRITRAAPIMTAIDSSAACLALSWQQGEADMNLASGGATSMAGYLSVFLKLIDDTYASGVRVAFTNQTWSPIWLIGQLSAHNTYGNQSPLSDGNVNKCFCNPAIALAQWMATKQRDFVRIANPQYCLSFLNQAPSTTLHAKAEDHLMQGKYFARLMRKMLADGRAGRPFGNYCLEMVDFVLDETKTRLTVFFNVPEPPLVFDSSWVEQAKDQGFGIWTGTPGSTDGVYHDIIARVQLASDQSIAFSLREPLPDGAQLWAGRGNPNDDAAGGIGRGYSADVPAGARTNLRDSAGDDDAYIDGDGLKRSMHNYCIIHYLQIT